MDQQTRDKIDTEVWRLQEEVARHQRLLYPDGRRPPAAQMFQPQVAAQILGIPYELHDHLPLISGGVVAGMVDRQSNKIAVAQSFGFRAARFTGAHEVGHWLLHPDKVMFRDAPMKGLTSSSAEPKPLERQANYFAGCYLVPDAFIFQALKQRFPLTEKGKVILNDVTAGIFDEPDSEVFRSKSREELAFMIAAKNGRFPKLGDVFDVSTSTIAYRLLEVEAV